MQGLAKMDRVRGAMELVDVERPTPGPEEALLEVEYAGLCGSDAGIYKFKAAYERMNLPTILGHEYVGNVVEIGDRVSSVSVGDRVVERPIRGCGSCYHCERGLEQICNEATIRGVDEDGAFAEYVSVPADTLLAVPADVETRHAAITEPTSIATRAVIHNSRVRSTDRVLVLGPGPIGMLTAQVARSQGGRVLVAGIEQDASYRLPLAEALGFETTTVEDDGLEPYRTEWTDDIGFDVVFDTTGHPSGLGTAVSASRKGGQIVLVGLTPETTLDFAPLVRSELDVQCSYGSGYEDFERAFRVIASGDVDAEEMIDTRFSLLEHEDVFEAFLAGETCKAVFDVSELRA